MAFAKARELCWLTSSRLCVKSLAGRLSSICSRIKADDLMFGLLPSAFGVVDVFRVIVDFL